MTWENRIILEASSADPDSDTPVWVDLSSRIRDAVQPLGLGTGRQNDLDTSEPAVLQVLLDSSDDALTYGNTAGPFPWWGPGRRIRWREVIGGVNVPQFDGFVSPNPTETVTTRGIEQRVAVTATDRLGRLATAEPFVSTLAAYVLTTTPPAYYWPLLDRSTPLSPVLGDSPLTPVQLTVSTGGVGTGATASAFAPGQGTAIRADDQDGVLLTVADGGGFSTNSFMLSIGTAGSLGGVVPPAGFVAAGGPMVLVWASPQLPFDDTVNLIKFHLAWGVSSVATCVVSRSVSASGGIIRLDVTGSVTGSVVSTVVLGTDRFFMIGAQVVPDTASTAMSLWIDDQVFTGAGTGTGGLVTGLVCDSLGFGGKLQGTLAHAQVYTTALTTQQLADQRTMALLGLERQATGDRIRAIARYAGIPASQLNQIDTGTSVMQRARLAGQTPLDAMRDAERTEQGLLYCDGNGSLVFKDRRTLYNI